MDEARVRERLAEVGLSPSRVEPTEEQGWANWTFELDGALIARFARNDEIRDATAREIRLLPALAAHVSFRVPMPIASGDGFFVYEKIPGRPFRRGDDLDAAVAVIDELHTFPADEAACLLDRGSWREQQEAYRNLFEREAVPVLDEALAERVRAAYVPPCDFEPVLVHYDLGPEHVLVDDRGRAVGLIDFEDAHVGDPEVDLIGVYDEAGQPFTDRMRFYRWVGSLHALVYYLREGLDTEIPGAVEELRGRLDEASRR